MWQIVKSDTGENNGAILPHLGEVADGEVLLFVSAPHIEPDGGENHGGFDDGLDREITLHGLG